MAVIGDGDTSMVGTGGATTMVTLMVCGELDADESETVIVPLYVPADNPEVV